MSIPSFVGGIGQHGIIDHLSVAVTLRLHRRGAEAEFSVFVGAEMILQNLDPCFVETRRRAGLPAIIDHVLNHAADCRLTLIVGALPFLIDGPEFVPVRTFGSGRILRIGRTSITERDDPVLQQIAFRIRLNVDGHIFIMRRLAALRLVVVILSAFGTGECCSTRGSRLQWCSLDLSVHGILLGFLGWRRMWSWACSGVLIS